MLNKRPLLLPGRVLASSSSTLPIRGGQSNLGLSRWEIVTGQSCFCGDWCRFILLLPGTRVPPGIHLMNHSFVVRIMNQTRNIDIPGTVDYVLGASVFLVVVVLSTSTPAVASYST